MENRTRLVLLAHGSRDPRWCAPFDTLIRRLRQELGRDTVTLAYMEFVAPTLADVAFEAARDGVTHLRILPMFMASGAHLSTDVPKQMAEIEGRLPRIRLKLLPAIGEDPRMATLIHEISVERATRRLLRRNPVRAPRLSLARGTP